MGWTIAASIVGGVVFLLLAVMFFVALVGYRKLFDRRYNGNSHVHYFTADDFEGLQAEPICFPSDRGDLLHGFIYRDAAVLSARGLVVFSHAFGAGHQAYTTEIATLAHAGFWVLAYDGTGCVSSEGKTFRGFDQGPLDFAAALRFASQDARLKDFKRVAVGHSWGDFSVLNSLSGEVPVCGAVAMCGFVSCAGVMAQSVFGHIQPCAALFSLYFRIFNRVRFGKDANRNVLRSLRKATVPVFVIYGKSDCVVPFYGNGKRVLRLAEDLPHVRGMLCENKGHNVYLTEDAERYMNETFSSISSQSKKQPQLAEELYAKADYRRMTQEDEGVMRAVVDFCLQVI